MMHDNIQLMIDDEQSRSRSGKEVDEEKGMRVLGGQTENTTQRKTEEIAKIRSSIRSKHRTRMKIKGIIAFINAQYSVNRAVGQESRLTDVDQSSRQGVDALQCRAISSHDHRLVRIWQDVYTITKQASLDGI